LSLVFLSILAKHFWKFDKVYSINTISKNGIE